MGFWRIYILKNSRLKNGIFIINLKTGFYSKLKNVIFIINLKTWFYSKLKYDENN